MSHTPPVDPSPAAAAAEVPPELAPRPMTGPEALDAAAAAGPDAFARALNGVIGALEDAARHYRERQAELPCDEHQVTFNGFADGSVEWTCRCGAGEVAVSPAAAEAEADAHTGEVPA
jgi:hypothetical protein